MIKLPDYLGVVSFGVKMGVILPGSDLVGMVYEALEQVNSDGLLDDGDVICVTESAVARSQNNYVTVKELAAQVQKKLGLKETSRVGVLFPILSRNRFSLILKGIAAAVPQGEVVIQLSYPADEVGNRLLPDSFVEALGRREGEIITFEEAMKVDYRHPITGVNYLELYTEIVRGEGAKAQIFLCNQPQKIVEYGIDGLVISNIHERERTREKIKPLLANCITLQEICNEGSAYSEWGVLGSNLSSGDRLKLPPRHADKVAEEIQRKVREGLSRQVEVIVYGDGAYRDPTTGIYELADPRPAFGVTQGIQGRYREGYKYKFLADTYHLMGKSREEIEAELEAKRQEAFSIDSLETEGTTPRRLEDVLASLADLVSGSADAGTPVVVVKNFLGSARKRE